MIFVGKSTYNTDEDERLWVRLHESLRAASKVLLRKHYESFFSGMQGDFASILRRGTRSKNVSSSQTPYWKDGRILVLAAAIITGLRLARDPRAGSKTERVIDAVEDGIFLANQIYEMALLRFGQGNIDFKWCACSDNHSDVQPRINSLEARKNS